jgi:hypothetical protein
MEPVVELLVRQAVGMLLSLVHHALPEGKPVILLGKYFPIIGNWIDKEY